MLQRRSRMLQLRRGAAKINKYINNKKKSSSPVMYELGWLPHTSICGNFFHHFSANCCSRYMESFMDASLVTEHSKRLSAYCKTVDFPGTGGSLHFGGALGRNKGPQWAFEAWLSRCIADFSNLRRTDNQLLGSTAVLNQGLQQWTILSLVSLMTKGCSGFATTGKWGITISLIALKSWGEG